MINGLGFRQATAKPVKDNTGNFIPNKPSVEERPGYKHVHTFEPGNEVVGIIEFNSRVYVATKGGVYFINDDEELEEVHLADHTEGRKTTWCKCPTCENLKGDNDEEQS